MQNHGQETNSNKRNFIKKTSYYCTIVRSLASRYSNGRNLLLIYFCLCSHDFDIAGISENCSKSCPRILVNYFLLTLLYSQILGLLWKPPGREAGKKTKCTLLNVMAIRVVEFSNGGYKIRKIFA